MAALITPYKHGIYPSIEGNDRAYFNEEFRRIEQTLAQITNTLSLNTYSTTIASGEITLPNTAHLITLVTVDTNSAPDDLDTITSTQAGKILIVTATNTARTIVLKDGTDNLILEGDCTLNNTEDTITLVKIGNNWQEIARANNGA